MASGNVGCFLRLIMGGGGGGGGGGVFSLANHPPPPPPPPPLLHNNYMKMECCDFFRRVDYTVLKSRKVGVL